MICVGGITAITIGNYTKTIRKKGVSDLQIGAKEKYASRKAYTVYSNKPSTSQSTGRIFK